VIRAVVVAAVDLAPELGGTVLFRHNVHRLRASGAEDVRKALDEGRLDVVVVDTAMPGAAAIVAALRQDPMTRPIAIVALGRSEFGFDHLDLLEAGANAILPLPPGLDWDDRLMRLIHVPLRRATRFPVDMAFEGGLLSGIPFTGRALNLSVHGLLLECPQPLRVGEDLRFSFEMPGTQEGVRGTGTVVRAASANHFGVELTHVEEDGRVKIKRYVESGGPD
jgi:CheY-like chemotaxis protein